MIWSMFKYNCFLMVFNINLFILGLCCASKSIVKAYLYFVHVIQNVRKVDFLHIEVRWIRY